ncbi:hypothetical protein JYU34_007862 [Plutella xylostella]|uniref:Uncharacterized protein n=1 Tax=Plutella xylostella TaxID=51655 RepID=A0ABQ7QRN3_PLUXY|nr:hypothetical protein JYU34_007862 [Plutella xylostella]
MICASAAEPSRAVHVSRVAGRARGAARGAGGGDPRLQSRPSTMSPSGSAEAP